MGSTQRVGEGQYNRGEGRSSNIVMRGKDLRE